MPPELVPGILGATGAHKVQGAKTIQELWSGYGGIVRIHLTGGCYESIIAKIIKPPASPQHRYGWDDSFAHQRKLRSYEVELHWYKNVAPQLGDALPHHAGFIAALDTHWDSGSVFLIEDLDQRGFSGRPTHVQPGEARAVLTWLAQFHGACLGHSPSGLWPVGTYWHLATRPRELAALPADLHPVAHKIDRALNDCAYQTLVHGDAKLANFCFGETSKTGSVAAVDFQYVGGGCGMKDVAYFLSSIYEGTELAQFEGPLLDHYFKALRLAIEEAGAKPQTSGQGAPQSQSTVRPRLDSLDMDKLEQEWRTMYDLAWADFVRFLMGWRAGHWKLHDYALAKFETVRDRLT